MLILSCIILNTLLIQKLRSNSPSTNWDEKAEVGMPRGTGCLLYFRGSKQRESQTLGPEQRGKRAVQAWGHAKIATQSGFNHISTPVPPIHYSILRYQFLVSHSAHKTLKID